MERKSKKKASFLSKAKKFAAKGLYGKGKNIDEETYQYYVQVMKRLNENFNEEEEKGIFADNVFSQTVGCEVELVCNQLVSRVLEKLLTHATHDAYQQFAKALSSDLRIVCTDAFASHVLEKMMKLASDFIDQNKRKALQAEPEAKKHKQKESESSEPEETKKDDDHLTFCNEWLLKVSRFVLNNMEEFVSNTYASHVVRTMLQCVSGVTVASDISKSRKSRDQADQSGLEDTGIKTRDKVFLEVLQEFTTRLMSWPQFSDLVYVEASAATLQTLLLVLSGSTGRLLPPLLELMSSQCFIQKEVAENEMPEVFKNPSAQRTLEAALSVATASFFTDAFEKLFKGRLMQLCNSESKFAVTALLSSCKDKEKFEEIYEELETNLKSLATEGGSGVVVALAKACKNLGTNQRKFLKKLMEIYDCEDTEEGDPKFVQSAVSLHASKNPSSESKCTLDGSLLVQSLLHFQKPIKVINSLLALGSPELRDIFCSPCGSHIMDSFVSSPSVGEKSRDRLRAKLKGEYAALACSKNGSRAFDSLWAASDIKSRAVIGQELLTREAAVSGNQWGSIIFGKHAISLLKKRKSDWEAFQGQETKKKKLFKDFLTPPASGNGDNDAAKSEPSLKKKKHKKRKEATQEEN